MTRTDLPVVAVVGPTGTGKTALGVELALRLGGEVVNADSMQFYRGMDIGTAKATAQERRGVPHHLLDVLDVTEEASVADFQRAARTRFAQIRARGRVPVLVGGSGLYVRAALDVLELPGTDPAVRARIEDELAARGPGALRERLRQVDPASAARLQDERRLVRALEVWELTGRPFTSFMPRREHVEPTVQIGLDLERAALHDRLARRVGAMVEAGLETEVRALAARGLREGRTASRALGYGQFLDVVDGRVTVAEAVEATVVATRRFARRQRTWFRADPRVHWLDPAAPGLAEGAVDVVERVAAEG
ncbi:tRNA (adenosine(37)-N6)-dimethylallyltransferase MiaA [Kocuria rosea]|uniref:tRNA dimethylallyltransferase n=1 Tax=Kocuria rosea TaxID=1275 RepID=A0A4V3B2V8_KOCRO|nr:tRNA (adenosine(37)-N6)-dimethylallyltransferase MiaA [Kocuria rosea]TDL42309.1 tRNA (adenosine(37)-N6)-dimethylallyltransferase MiaA [Kocuria rosea]